MNHYYTRASILAIMLIGTALGLFADSQTATLYYCGTGAKGDWWDGDKVVDAMGTFGFFRPELVATLHHAQVTGPGQHKAIVDGIGTGEPLDMLWAASPSMHTGEEHGRNWQTCLDEGMAFLQDVARQHPEEDILLNLIGWSRGGVLTMMTAHALVTDPQYAELNKQIRHINIIAYDPVPGDPLLDYRMFTLAEKVRLYLGFYALDERSFLFDPVIPAAPNGTAFHVFALPGSHETMVGNTQVDGHSIDLDPTDAMEVWLDEELGHISWLVKAMSQETLGTAACGRVSFNDDWREGASDPEVLKTRIKERIRAMYRYAAYDKMRDTAFVPPLVSYRDSKIVGEGCRPIRWFGQEDQPRCAFKQDPASPKFTLPNTALPNAVPTLDPAGEQAWDFLLEQGNLPQGTVPSAARGLSQSGANIENE